MVVSADVRGALLSATETLKPDVLILGSSGSVPSALHSSFSRYSFTRCTLFNDALCTCSTRTNIIQLTVYLKNPTVSFPVESLLLLRRLPYRDI